MKKGIVLLMCLLVFFLTTLASGADPKIKPQTKKGDAALLFCINGLGNFGVTGARAGYLVATDAGGNIIDQTPAGLGFKYFLSNNVALRMGVGLSTSSVTTETAGGDETEGSSMISLQANLEYHLFQVEAVTIYTGGGLFFTVAGTSQELGDNKTSNSASGIGLGGMLGAEFYPWRNVSFGAEYWLGYAKGSSKADNGVDETDGPSVSVLRVQAIGVILGIHF